MNTDTSMDFYLSSSLEGTKSPEINGSQLHEDAKECESFATANNLIKLTMAKPRMAAFHPH